MWPFIMQVSNCYAVVYSVPSADKSCIIYFISLLLIYDRLHVGLGVTCNTADHAQLRNVGAPDNCFWK